MMDAEWALSLPLLVVYAVLALGASVQAYRLSSAAAYTTQHVVFLLASLLLICKCPVHQDPTTF